MPLNRRNTQKNKRSKTKRMQHGGEVDGHEANKLVGAIGRFFENPEPTWGNVANQRPLDLFHRYLQLLSKLASNEEYHQMLDINGFRERVGHLLDYISNQDKEDTTFVQPNYSLVKAMGVASYFILKPEIINLSKKLLESLTTNEIPAGDVIEQVTQLSENFTPWGRQIRVEQTNPRFNLVLVESGTWKGKEMGVEELQASQEASQEIREYEDEKKKQRFLIYCIKK